jgi:putative endonuclease
MPFYVYILASKRNGTLYTGMTDDLIKRVWQHRNKMVEGFTKEHNIRALVWYEVHDSRASALTRER